MEFLRLPFREGIISAFYFIVLDLILSTMLDTTLAKYLNHLYYQQINQGIPIRLIQRDIIGVSNFQLGSYLSKKNMLITVFKLFFLGLVLTLDRTIFSGQLKDYERHVQLATFNMDSTEAAWGDGFDNVNRIVERRWDKVRNCRKIIPENQTIIYYHVSFNLSNNLDLDTEIVPDSKDFKEINDSTLICHSEKEVKPEEEWEIAQVHGCSKLRNAADERNNRTQTNDCGYQSSITKDFEFKPVKKELTRFEQYEYKYDVIEYSKNEVLDALPEYQDLYPTLMQLDMVCLRTKYHLTEDNFTLIDSCLLTVEDENSTTFDRWSFNEDTQQITRLYRGPMFKGRLNAGVFQKSNFLWNAQFHMEWIQLSSNIVAESSVYARVQKATNILTKTQNVTIIPYYAVGIFAFMTISILLLRFVLLYLFIARNDSRPQLNSIDGLSSIAREESTPSGDSLNVGPPAYLGFSKMKNSKSLRFGILKSISDGCKGPDSSDQIFDIA